MSKWTVPSLVACATVAAALAYACVDSGNTDVTCPTYCKGIQETCTGADQQFPDDPTCERFCAKMDPGEAGAASGDTVACRKVAISSAKDETDPAKKHVDCASGGIRDKCVNDDPCVGFCNLDLALCPTSLSLYTDVNDCIGKCKTWGQAIDGALLGSTGNTLQCRTYHLELAMTGDPTDVQTHCPHTGQVSARCQDPADAGSDASADAAADAGGD